MNYKLRPWNLTDLNTVCKHADNIAITRFMSDGFPNSYEKWAKFIDFASTNKDIMYLAIEIDGDAVGGIGISLQKDYKRMNAELGYWLSEKYWSKGIMTEAIKKMVHLSFSSFEINRIFATPFENNPASHRVLEKAGFILEVRLPKTIIKNEVLLDEFVYAIRRNG